MGRVVGALGRVESRRSAREYVDGLLSSTERKNCCVAEKAGYAHPDAMQRLLRTASWDAEAVRDDVRLVVLKSLAHLDGC
jgi:SRSO17 transposase